MGGFKARGRLWLAAVMVVVVVAAELVGTAPVASAPTQKGSEPQALASQELEGPDRTPPQTLDTSKVPAGAKGLTGDVLSRYVAPTVSDGETKVLVPVDSTPVEEVVGERTAESETWVNVDGTRTLKVFDQPKYFQQFGSGEWVPIDSSLVIDETRPGWVRNAANS